MPTEDEVIDPDGKFAGLVSRAHEWAKKPFEVTEVEALQEFWTEDALLIPFEAPVVSSTRALLKYYEQVSQLPGFKVEWEPVSVDLSADGGLGYVVGRHWVTVDDPEGRTHRSEGRDVSIWRRDEGDWRWCVQIWNPEPAA